MGFLQVNEGGKSKKAEERVGREERDKEEVEVQKKGVKKRKDRNKNEIEKKRVGRVRRKERKRVETLKEEREDKTEQT